MNGQFKEAIPYFLKSMQIAESLNNERDYIYTGMNLLRNYANTVQKEKAEEFARVLQSRSENLSNIPRLREGVFKVLEETHVAFDNFEGAYHALKSRKMIQDSLFSVDKTKTVSELETQYQVKEKEQQIAIQEAQLNQQRLINYGIGGLAFLLSAFAYFIYRNSQQRKRINQQLTQQNTTIAQQNQQLQSLDQAKSNFFTNISHELRTPLTLILGPLEKVIENTKNNSDKADLQLAQKNSQKLLSLVNEIMDLSKLGIG